MAGPSVHKVRCPSCAKSLRVDLLAAGQSVVCPACGQRSEVPNIPLLGPLVGGEDQEFLLIPQTATAFPTIESGRSEPDVLPPEPLTFTRWAADAPELTTSVSATAVTEPVIPQSPVSTTLVAEPVVPPQSQSVGLESPQPIEAAPVFVQPATLVQPAMESDLVADWEEPVMVQGPRGVSTGPTLANTPPPAGRPTLRLLNEEGPDPEDQVVPMMMDRSGAEPGWVPSLVAWAGQPPLALTPATMLPVAVAPPAVPPTYLPPIRQDFPPVPTAGGSFYESPRAMAPGAGSSNELFFPALPLPAALAGANVTPTRFATPDYAPVNQSEPFEPIPVTPQGLDLSAIEMVGGPITGHSLEQRGHQPTSDYASPVGSIPSISGNSSKAGWWAAASVLFAGLLAAGWLVATGQLDAVQSWDAQTGPKVAELKQQAESYAASGLTRDAEQSYRKIEQLVAGHEIQDPALKQSVEQASREARRLATQLAARKTPASTDAQSVPAVDSQAVTPGPDVTQTPPNQPTQPVPANPPAPAVASAEPLARPRPPIPGVVVPEDPDVPRPPPVSRERTRPEDQPQPARVAENPVARPSNRPVPRPAKVRQVGVTDEEIGQSIQLGVNYLLRQYDAKTHLLREKEAGDNSYTAGLNSLAAYALLQAGQAIEDPRLQHTGPEMRAMTKAVRTMPIDGFHQTYARGLRSTCLALFNQPDDFKTMADDADWLLGTTEGGAYGYNGTYKKPGLRGAFLPGNGSWDNSNSQYGLLGVWSAADADSRVEVPMAYWKAVAKHWSDMQSKDGQWGYNQGGGRLSMTSAGIASLFVAHEFLESANSATAVGRDPFPPALKKGLAWFEQGNNSVSVRDGNWWGYQLYGIERVGLASGFKQFGRHDWYRELAAVVLDRQHQNGSWGEETVDTAYALLFLSRGRHPIMMNKLRFEGYWSNRPRDVANASRFATRQLERPINWQVVNVTNPWTDWTDSPILYIASHLPLPITEEQTQKFKRFVEAGGMIVTHADASAPAFDKWAKELANKLFPIYEMSPIPDNHPLWTTAYKVNGRPPALGVSNGSRLLMVHFPQDIASKWQRRDDKLSKPTFELGVNLFLYAAGKRDLRNRLDSAWVEAPTSTPIDNVRIARLRYEGNWDPEPVAWLRYANWFQRQTSVRLEAEPIRLSDLSADTARTIPIAHLTGTDHARFTDAEIAGLRNYVQAGGLVIIDSTGGMNGFDVDVRESLLPKAFPNRSPLLVDQGHPLLSATGPGMEDLAKTRVRPFTFERFGVGVGSIQLLTPEKAQPGRPIGGILVTSLDLTSGLLGISTWGIIGFDPKYCQSLVKNTIFWAQDGMPMK